MATQNNFRFVKINDFFRFFEKLKQIDKLSLKVIIL